LRATVAYHQLDSAIFVLIEASVSTVLTEHETVAPSAAELAVLRELARKGAEIAAQPIQAERIPLWTAHNDLQPGRRPLLLAFPAGA
jgi:hypothetical protein